MPLTPAEKQKRYREKLKQQNTQKYEEMKKKDSERALKYYYHKKSKYSEKDKEEQRLKWREDRKKAKELHHLNITQNTLPNVDENIETLNLLHRKKENSLKKENKDLRSQTLIFRKKLQAMRKKLIRQKRKLEELEEKYNNAMKMIADMNKNNQDNPDDAKIKAEIFINENLENIDADCKEKVKKKN